MKVGDLVRIVDVESDDTRRLGTIMRFDRYFEDDRYHTKKHNIHGEDIAEVLWSNSNLGWILRRRLEVICGN